MKSYKNMLKLLDQDKLSCVHYHSYEEADSSYCAEEKESSEMTYAAANGYTEFFEKFDSLDEKQKQKLLAEKNGGLAFMMAAEKGAIDILKILLKQSYIQEILNQPFKALTFDTPDRDVPFLHLSIRNGLRKMPAAFHFPDVSSKTKVCPFTLAQLALERALFRKNTNCVVLLYRFKISKKEVAEDKKIKFDNSSTIHSNHANNTSSNKDADNDGICEKLDLICQSIQIADKWTKLPIQLKENQDLYYLSFENQALYGYAHLYLSKMAVEHGFEVGKINVHLDVGKPNSRVTGKNESKNDDDSETTNTKANDIPNIYVTKVTLAKLQNCPPIPPLNTFEMNINSIKAYLSQNGAPITPLRAVSEAASIQTTGNFNVSSTAGTGSIVSPQFSSSSTIASLTKDLSTLSVKGKYQ